VILIDRLLVGGLRFVLDKVATAVDAEMNDERSLKEDLLAAQMRLELGEIDEEEFAEIEREVVARLREIRTEEGGGGAVSFEAGSGGGIGVEVEVEVGVEFAGDERGAVSS
jgi:gas vesicle protein GvpG